MKILPIILLFTKLCGINSVDANDIPEMHLRHLHILDPPGYTIVWDPIDYHDENNPIIGIKIKIWQPSCVKKIIHRILDGKEVETEEIYRQKFGHYDIPEETPVISIVTPEKSNYTASTAELNVWYHIRTLAFTKTAEGPLSGPYHFKINPENEDSHSTECKTFVSKPTSSAKLALVYSNKHSLKAV